MHGGGPALNASRSEGRRARALWLYAALAAAGLAVFTVLAALDAASYPVGGLERRAPVRTALMRQRETEARAQAHRYRVDQRWVPYRSISPLLRRAVLIAEDDKFFAHGGLDWDEIQASARKNLAERRTVRGGSTITQQLAKNLYLGNQRTLTRKLKEVFLAFRLERALSKRRIFELYLNLIEWGSGIYGAEAAARRYFGVSARSLNERQALLLAAVIVNPLRFSPLEPSRQTERRVRMIARRMRRRGFLNQEQFLAAIGQPTEPQSRFSNWFFGPRPDTAASRDVPAAPESSDSGTTDDSPPDSMADSISLPPSSTIL
jgi:monofunctional biosynthetic peptidoglycan transglycosylase